MEDGLLMGFIVAFFAFFVFLFIVAIILFFFQAIGLFKIAKREGKGEIAWLAWIPVVNAFLLTLLVEQDVHPSVRGKFTLWYGVAVVISLILSSFVPFVSFIPMAMFFYAFYFLAKRYSDNAVLHLVIGIITFGFSTPIQIFIFRKRDMKLPQEVVV
ncbi:hypothetical protein SPD48_06325 [Pseudogracilibacillus sp. SE30717A]|uniref:hypothetical protein n=1 Tax=Pseudogracilibacillus sp. SE30717A TaxID=3098293 RepID=UPI00300DFE2C